MIIHDLADVFTNVIDAARATAAVMSGIFAAAVVVFTGLLTGMWRKKS